MNDVLLLTSALAFYASDSRLESSSNFKRDSKSNGLRLRFQHFGQLQFVVASSPDHANVGIRVGASVLPRSTVYILGEFGHPCFHVVVEGATSVAAAISVSLAISTASASSLSSSLGSSQFLSHRIHRQMNPFCCASPVPVSPVAAAASAFSSSAATHPLPALPPPPPPPPPPPLPPSSAAAGRSRDSFPHQNHTTNGGSCWPSGPAGAAASDHVRHHRASGPAPEILASASFRSSFHDAPLEHREVRLNNIVSNGIAGILHKWVNYGKGWRPRWFVLQDGVLSYYKIHGPDRIEVSQESEKGSKVIGEESIRRISRRKNGRSHLPRKPIGEVHLKARVSSIRESRSDDKRFSIFTGTRRLHLRAETREDRVAWMESLQAVKDMFPRNSNGEFTGSVDKVVVSTDKLRQRLQEEGLNDATIQECEQIMRSEFAALQNQLMLLKQNQNLLVDHLGQLEV
ncbi:hypothetical protein BHE74_00023038 [Ensete ventricosum]|nr:hypothetical protein BHE74_00023038 [Ensete ventricosum]